MNTSQSFSKNNTTMRVGEQLVDLSAPLVMGIVNVTPDSFFAESRSYTADTVAARVCQVLQEGGRIVDLGAYSSRPGAAEVSEQEELRRLSMGMEIIRSKFPQAIASIDSFRSSVIAEVVRRFGAVVVNDISGGELDAKMFETVAKLGLPYILMHMRGNPKTMQQLTSYENLLAEMMQYFSGKIRALHQMGVADIILDPGFGFAKTAEQNFELMRQLNEFKIFELPLLVGVSRKAMIYRTLGVAPEESLNGTTVLNTIALGKGAKILRVHDVKAAVEATQLHKFISHNS
ncbi:MAG: dihydropteroate synthase [Prevotellaceae bacterium]|jgi:dihydropteroate synthase|nr:dihydropteroate synthase [Prevotellaceae bacterium]